MVWKKILQKKKTFAAQMPEESAFPERSRRTNSLTNIRKERQGRQKKKCLKTEESALPERSRRTNFLTNIRERSGRGVNKKKT
jgi:hypothetical protein